MGQTNAKTQLMDAVEKENVDIASKILDKFPETLNAPFCEESK